MTSWSLEGGGGVADDDSGADDKADNFGGKVDCREGGAFPSNVADCREGGAFPSNVAVGGCTDGWSAVDVEDTRRADDDDDEDDDDDDTDEDDDNTDEDDDVISCAADATAAEAQGKAAKVSALQLHAHKLPDWHAHVIATRKTNASIQTTGSHTGGLTISLLCLATKASTTAGTACLGE